MNALKTARVCVIDDQKEEYLPLIHALSRIGMGCCHYTGTKVEELPTVPLPGLRLVFLDMQLETSGESTQVAAHTAKVFATIVSEQGGPVLVVFWTKHEHHVAAFKERLYAKYQGFLGRLIFAHLEKPVSAIDGSKLEAAILAELKKYHPLDLIWQWEQSVQDAASSTSAAIASLAAFRAGVSASDTEKQTAKKIHDAYGDLLRLVLEAAAGRNSTKESALRDLHAGLAPMHFDRLEHALQASGESSAKRLLQRQKPKAKPSECAAINAMLLLAPADSDAKMLGPGSLYTVPEVARFKRLFGHAWPAVAGVILKGEKVTSDECAQILKQCHPILAEVSADCDFAQKKRPVARLVAGVMVPASLLKTLGDDKKLQSANYLRAGESLRFAEPNGDWVSVFIGQFVYSLARKRMPRGLTPIGRLRSGPLADLRHWLAAQATRPGYLSVH
jgi:hypothetical protein